MTRTQLAALLLTFGASSACGPTLVEDLGSTGDHMSFEEFEASTYLEPWQDGVYVVNGDSPIEDIKALREFYDELYPGQSLAVARSGNQDRVWSSAEKHQLTYCVSDAFGARKAQMVAAMAAVTDSGWEAVADVDFIHDASQDSACTGTNQNVVFDVRPVSGQPYLARAFFPGQSRPTRNILVDSTSFNSGWPLEGVLLHEVGHALGFRHEHTRPEARACFEDSNWRALTPYDSTSVMHYPQCNGSGPPLTMSNYDAEGAAALYGLPAGGGGGGGGGGPAGSQQTTSASGQLDQGQTQAYEGVAVVPGTVFQVEMTGTGDADLYVRFDAAPTLSAYDCRPYLSGSRETCSLDVPADASTAHIMVRGYTAASFDLTATWTAPAP